MTDKFGILGQAAPSGGVLTDIYTVPTGKRATIRIVVTNRSTDSSFRAAVSLLGAAIANGHYIAYDEAILANESVVSAPIEVSAGDIVRVRGTSANISFTVTGLEEDVT